MRLTRHVAQSCALAVSLALLVGPALAQSGDREREVEADWTTQEAERHLVTAREDALGAVDGVKDGKWAFHTGSDNPPWWQVDLGQTHDLDRAVIYNRADGAAPRTARLIVLLSDDGRDWRQVYQHNGETFYGAPDGKPLVVPLRGQAARFLRTQQPEASYLHLDEVEVYGAADPAQNLSLWKDADQSSTSIWSKKTFRPNESVAPPYMLEKALERGRRLAADLGAAGVDTADCLRVLGEVERAAVASGADRPALWRQARWAVRRLAFRNPLLDFDRLVFVKRAPSSFSHMSDQYYGWWSRPGGGVYILTGLKGDSPSLQGLTTDMPEGSFLEPELSYDGKKILFAYCKFYPHVAAIADKEHKENVPEDAFYHVFEMNVDGSNRRQLTQGRYDDFSARYLPSGEIVFLSTRRGQFLQTGRAAAQETLTATLPDCYVRCGGDPYRPVAVYTLHVMDGEGGDLRCISPFESFEWNPSVMADGRIMYARWDYVDRSNMPYMKLWTVNPDGTNPRALYGNFTTSFHCAFEARSIPASTKIAFTASAHHAITAGALVMLDPLAGFDDLRPLTKLTPEVAYPETESWPATFYVTPYPLSERYYLTSWSNQPIISQSGLPTTNGPGLYLFDAFGNLELIYRDPDIACMSPQPLRPRPRPPVIPSSVDWPQATGSFVLQDVYRGLRGIAPGTVKALRIVGVPAKTQPNMNTPNLGVTTDDPGKFVLGTVPVEEDGSAYFRVPAGTIVFFQALDQDGLAVQTMRTVTAVQPGQTLSCVGCHEPRHTAPLSRRPMALARGPSKITPGPEGSWPLRFDRLVQPVLDRRCVSCHQPGGHGAQAAAFDLKQGAYERLLGWGQPSLGQRVQQGYAVGRSQPGDCEAQQSRLLAMLRAGHHDVKLDGDDLARLVTWMDTYAQRQGAFSDDQEQRLVKLREDMKDILTQ